MTRGETGCQLGNIKISRLSAEVKICRKIPEATRNKLIDSKIIYKFFMGVGGTFFIFNKKLQDNLGRSP